MSGRRNSFDAVPETCPTVDRIFETACDAIKDKVTQPFREALTEAHEKIEELEERVSDLENANEILEGQISELKQQEDA